MKGVTIILLLVLIAVLSVITAMGIYFFATSSNVEGVKRSIIERGIVGEINKLEFLKQNLHQALDYSFYQSKYEVAKLGGYTTLTQASVSYNNLPYWRVYTTTYPPPYIKSLEDRTLELYNIYNNSIKTEISKPGATKVTIERKITPSIDYAVVIAIATKPIRLEKPNLTIEESGTINETIRTKIFVQFDDIGKYNFITKDKIKETIIDAINSFGKSRISSYNSNTQSSTGSKTACDYCPGPEEVFIYVNSLTFAQAEQLMKEEIDHYLDKLEKELSTPDISVLFLNREIKTEVGYSCQSEWDGCCACDEGCCSLWCTTDCYYYYFGAVRTLVNITDKTWKYAVYDGTTDLRNIVLRFYVVTGNKELISATKTSSTALGIFEHQIVSEKTTIPPVSEECRERHTVCRLQIKDFCLNWFKSSSSFEASAEPAEWSDIKTCKIENGEIILIDCEKPSASECKSIILAE